MKIKLVAQFDDETTGTGIAFEIPDDTNPNVLRDAVRGVIDGGLDDFLAAVYEKARERQRIVRVS